MGSYDHLPSDEYRNDGWTVSGSGVVKLNQAWDNDDDTKFCRCPGSKGGGSVVYPIDISTIPDGAVITSVTVFLRCARVGATSRSVTMNVSCRDDTTRYTSRTIYPTTSPVTYEIGTYKLDPLGRPWDIHRLNKLILRVFTYAAVFDCIRVYKLYARVNYRVRPTVTIEQPTGTVLTPSPTIAWTYTQTDGDPQSKVEYKIFTAIQNNDATFNPELSPPLYATTLDGDVATVTLPTSLNPDAYYVWVRVYSSFQAKSLWTGRGFSVQGPAPAIPGNDNAGITGTPGVGVATVVPDSYTSSASITLRDASNLLSVQSSDFETTTDSLEFTPTNCVLTQDTSTFFSAGVASMKMVASSSATMSAVGVFTEVSPSTPVTARVQMKTAVTSRTVNLIIEFYDELFNLLTSVTGTGTDATATWTEIVTTGTSHASTAFAKVRIDVVSAANAEVHNADHIGLMYGTNSGWSYGGHMSRNLLTAHLATGDDPVSGGTGSWIAGNAATTTARVAVSGTGSHDTLMNRMTYTGLSPTIALRAAGSVFTTPTAGTDFTLNKPAGIVDNDFMLAFVTSTEHGTITPPAGWTAVNTASVDNGSNDVALWVLKRTGLAADPATWTTGRLSVSSSRRTAVVVAYSGAANATDQMVAENVKLDAVGNAVHTSAAVANTDPNAWRVAAFAARDDATGGSYTANIAPPTVPQPVTFVGKATHWDTINAQTSYTINRPTGVGLNDLMIAALVVFGTVTVTAPAGWTIVRQATQPNGTGPCTMAVFKRTATASEPSSWSGTISVAAKPLITQCVAYRNCQDASVQFLAENISQNSLTAALTTATAANTNSSSYRVCIFGATTGNDNATWTSSETSERADDFEFFYTATHTIDKTSLLAVFDSNGSVGTGNHSQVGYSNWDWYAAVSWIGLIKGLASPPAPGANETSRVNNTNGSSNPWLTTSVFDSAAVVPLGNTSVTGVFNNASPLSTASWVGLIKPAAPIVAGKVSAFTTTNIDISQVDPKVMTLAGNKITFTASFLGSAGGTPFLILDFYRANVNIGTQVAEGLSFNATTWRKSSATFTIPTGTTHIRAQVSATDRAVSDTVSFDRVGVSLGTSRVWRNGTGRTTHPLWSTPEIQYAEDPGTGYGPWKLLPGIANNPPTFDPLSGSLIFTDHTVTPLVARKYRVQTVSYGLAGDRFVSGYGPASAEVSLSAVHWWLKDITTPANNMLLRVRAVPLMVGTTNTSAVFQPLGEDFPLVLTEGYKGEAVDVTVVVDRTEFAQLRKLLQSGVTLYLQSNMDNAWWVRPVGDLKAETQVTGQRGTNPLRFVTVTFVQVKPEG